MRRHLPPLAWLRSFEAAARRLSFTRAAAELNMTQGAVSLQIKQLENWLGTLLFQRLPRGLQLTDAGEAYMPTVVDALDRLVAGTEDLFGSRKDEPLTVRATTSFTTL